MSIKEYIRPGIWVTMRFRRFRVLVSHNRTLYTWRTPAQVAAGMGDEVGTDVIASEQEGVDYVECNAIASPETTAILSYLKNESPFVPLMSYVVNPPAWCRANRNLPSTLLWMHTMDIAGDLKPDEERLIQGLQEGYIRAAFDFHFPVEFNTYPATIPRLPSLLPTRIPPQDKADLLWLAALLRNYNM